MYTKTNDDFYEVLWNRNICKTDYKILAILRLLNLFPRYKIFSKYPDKNVLANSIDPE